MLLGCIADDLTGATDLALMLTRNGMRTVQVMGVPEGPEDFAPYKEYDAVVVAMKSRTNPAAEAVGWSLRACDALTAAGARQILFKYCSTFDSTDAGNIGPVAEALLARLGGVALVCPAFPTNKRTVYMGNLFVGEVPLAESPMKDHPLTPMRDSNLVRVLQRQTKLKVGLVPYPVVANGAKAITTAIEAATAGGASLLVVDAITDQNLIDMGTSAAGHRLITGGSGIAMGLPANFERAGLMRRTDVASRMRAPKGRALVLAGSCSEATRGQLEKARAAGLPTFAIDPLEIHRGALGADQIIDWAISQPAGQPVIVYSSADPSTVKSVQDQLGRNEAGAMVERLLGAVAVRLADKGFNRLLVAGGETSGAVVGALGVKAIEIGPEIDPGVPWTRALDGREMVLALKSGNFGAPEFFIKAWETLA